MCNDIPFDRYCTRLFVGLFAIRGTRIILNDDFHLHTNRAPIGAFFLWYKILLFFSYHSRAKSSTDHLIYHFYNSSQTISYLIHNIVSRDLPFYPLNNYLIHSNFQIQSKTDHVHALNGLKK